MVKLFRMFFIFSRGIPFLYLSSTISKCRRKMSVVCSTPFLNYPYFFLTCGKVANTMMSSFVWRQKRIFNSKI